MKTSYIIHESLSSSIIKDIVTLLMLLSLAILLQTYAPGETVLQFATILALVVTSVYSAQEKRITTKEQALQVINEIYGDNSKA